jgi:hypothetical protein
MWDFAGESRKEKAQQEDLEVGGKKILKSILEKWDGVVWCGVVLINLAQDRDQRRALVNTVMNLRVI